MDLAVTASHISRLLVFWGFTISGIITSCHFLDNFASSLYWAKQWQWRGSLTMLTRKTLLSPPGRQAQSLFQAPLSSFLIQFWVLAPASSFVLWASASASLYVPCWQHVIFLSCVLYCAPLSPGIWNHLVFIVVKGLLTVSSSPVRGAVGIPVSTAVRSYVQAATRNTGLFISLLFSSLGGWKPGFSPTWKTGISQWERAQHASGGQQRMTVSTRNRSNDHLWYFQVPLFKRQTDQRHCHLQSFEN